MIFTITILAIIYFSIGGFFVINDGLLSMFITWPVLAYLVFKDNTRENNVRLYLKIKGLEQINSNTSLGKLTKILLSNPGGRAAYIKGYNSRRTLAYYIVKMHEKKI